MLSPERRPVRGTLKIYDLEIDSAFQRVKRGGRIIPLTPREYELLLLLATHRGQVVRRDEVLEHFYADDPDAAGRSNLVDVYIRFLRKKIDQGFWPRLILTRRRQGYLLRGGKV
jgi:DNA-binding response OmpR family regulator